MLNINYCRTSISFLRLHLYDVIYLRRPKLPPHVSLSAPLVRAMQGNCTALSGLRWLKKIVLIPCCVHVCYQSSQIFCHISTYLQVCMYVYPPCVSLKFFICLPYPTPSLFRVPSSMRQVGTAELTCLHPCGGGV